MSFSLVSWLSGRHDAVDGFTEDRKASLLMDRPWLNPTSSTGKL